MRPITIDLARGADKTVDSRIAPNGTIAVAQNVRVDQKGRLVTRPGYTSLGVSVHESAEQLEPYDLHTVGDQLIALGNNAPGVQTGIRAPYRLANTPAGVWRTEFNGIHGNDSVDFWSMPVADEVRIELSELSVTHSVALASSDLNVADVATTADGRYVCMVSCALGFFGLFVRISVVDAVGGGVVTTAVVAVGVSGNANPRVLAIGQVFYIFSQSVTTMNVNTLDMASASPVLSAATIVGAGATTYPGPYDVAVLRGTTNYLHVYATGTGYTWRRFSSANIQQGAAVNVASLANAPVSIQGDSANNRVNVVNVRTASGVELRTFDATTHAAVTGPTNVDPSGEVFTWVSVSRVDSSNIAVRYYSETSTRRRVRHTRVLVSTHSLTQGQVHEGVYPVSKAEMFDGVMFTWESLGINNPAPYGLTSVSTATNGGQLAATVLDGIAKNTFSAATLFHQSNIVRGIGSRWYVGLIGKDPRDETYRAYLVGFNVFSGKRRQGVANAGSLYLAGGNTAQFDRAMTTELGMETAPEFLALGSSGGGAKTALGTYTVQLVFRWVTTAGEVIQSAPSPPRTHTLPGGNLTLNIAFVVPVGLRTGPLAFLRGARLFLDIYTTEAGGSIPRFARALAVVATPALGQGGTSVTDAAADSVIQTGAPLYTQGADGSVSGRLPLGLASPATLVAESDGKLILGGLERDTQLHISLENRPGEGVGFVNDDLFFIQNPEPITAVAAGEDGRRYVFGRRNIRELIGTGPNAAGVGDISEPVEIDSHVGAVDWRSVCKTEFGIVFQAEAGTDDPKLYLLPRGGSTAIYISEGIRDILRQFPVVTAAVRHDAEQLLTFTLQSEDGTDGRLVHLDMQGSGLGSGGWQGRWIVDRVAALEGEQAPWIVEQTMFSLGMWPGGVYNIKLPQGRKLGDRILVVVASQGLNTSFVSGYSLLVNTSDSSSNLFRVHVQDLTTQARVAADTAAINMTTGAPQAVLFSVLLVRGSDLGTAIAVTGAGSAGGTPSALLTPPWGSANNLWISFGYADASNLPDPANVSSNNLTIWRTAPANYGNVERIGERPGALATTAAVYEMASAWRQTRATAQTAAWAAASAVASGTTHLAFKPLASTGTPARAAVAHQGRLVVCNSTDVLRSDPDAALDEGDVAIEPYVELATIYAMGAGGAARHLGITFVGELLDNCALTAWCSYDDGRNWVACRTYRLSPANGFHPGQTLRLQWTPRRRKVEGVRVRFVVTQEDGIASPVGGTTRGVAMNQAILWFEDLLGPSRNEYKRHF